MCLPTDRPSLNVHQNSFGFANIRYLLLLACASGTSDTRKVTVIYYMNNDWRCALCSQHSRSTNNSFNPNYRILPSGIDAQGLERKIQWARECWESERNGPSGLSRGSIGRARLLCTCVCLCFFVREPW